MYSDLFFSSGESHTFKADSKAMQLVHCAPPQYLYRAQASSKRKASALTPAAMSASH